MKFIPVLAAFFLWLLKFITHYFLGTYNFPGGPSDVAFSGLPFDLWAFVTISFSQPMVFKKTGKYTKKDWFSSKEQLIIGICIAVHFLLFFISSALVVIDSPYQITNQNYLEAMIIVGLFTYALPIAIVNRWFYKPQ